MDAGRNPVTGAIQCRSQFDPAAAVDLRRHRLRSAAAGPAARCGAAWPPTSPPACPTIRSAPADNARCRSPISPDDSPGISRLEQFVLSGFVSGDTSECSSCRAARSASRSAPNIGVRRRSTMTRSTFVTETAAHQRRRHPAVRSRRVRGEGGFRRDPDPDPAGHALLPRADRQRRGARRRLSGRDRHGLGLQCRRRLGADPRHPLPRQLRPLGARAEPVGDRRSRWCRTSPPGFLDPCDPARINTDREPRTANCTAASRRALLADDQRRPRRRSAIVSGSNPDLFAETSDSWTVGAVIQPRFIPGLSLSVDYYNITVNDIIISLTAQTIVNSCYDSPTLNNVFCPLFQRYPGRRALARSARFRAQILGNTLTQAPLNFASARSRGHRRQPELSRQSRPRCHAPDQPDLHPQSARSATSRIRSRPNFENRILGELGDPEDEFRLDLDLTYGAVHARLPDALHRPDVGQHLRGLQRPQ